MSKKTAFVFAGGASLGAFEVGMLKYLVEKGIKADLVLGTSVGSLNGAFYASNPTIQGVRKLEEIWDNIGFTDVFSYSPLTPVKSFFTFGKNLISPKNLRKVIVESLPILRVEDAEIPLYLIATDIRRGQEVVFNRGLILEALMSSVAIPGVFPPQHMGPYTLVDGGLINNTPISTAIRLGAERVVVFPINFPYSPDADPKNIERMLIQTVLFMINRQLSSDFEMYKDQVEIIIVPPPEDFYINPMDFAKSSDMIKVAYDYTKKWYDKGGYKPQKELNSQLMNVHSQKPFLYEAIVPDPDKNAKERIKDNVKPYTDKLKAKYNETTSKVKDSVEKSSDSIKEKFSSLKDKLSKKDD